MKKLLFAMLCAIAVSACAQPQPEPQQSKYPVEMYRTDKGRWVELSLIHHGSVAISYEGCNIQIDPVAGRGPQAVDYSLFAKPDFIFISHEHGDHMDVPTIESLIKDGTQIYSNGKSYETILKGEVRANGDSDVLNKRISVDYVPAYNSTPANSHLHPKGNGNGFVFTLDGLRIYVSGDSEDIPELAELKDIDIALLSANQPYTMTVEQCVRAAKVISPKVLIPYHLSNTDSKAIADALAGSGIEVHLYETLR